MLFLRNCSNARRPRDADPVTADSNHGPCFQCLAVPLEYLDHQIDPLLHRNIRQAHQPRVGRVAYIDEFREVGIERHQNPVFDLRVVSQFEIQPGLDRLG